MRRGSILPVSVVWRTMMWACVKFMTCGVRLWVVRGAGAFVCGEDLTTVPTVALEQDLALHAALGITHLERNGHHYFAGLEHLTEGERAAAWAGKPWLYGGTAACPFLRLESAVVQALPPTVPPAAAGREP